MGNAKPGAVLYGGRRKGKVVDNKRKVYHNDSMKTVVVNEAQEQLPVFLQEVLQGNEIAISSEADTQPIAILVQYDAWKKSHQRQLGTLVNRGSVTFAADYKMTEEEFIRKRNGARHHF
ncbi:hypothetical protein FACS189468_5380 [Spirochaetia bacterium]|nr:hypothetical protein FACS189468_5380 [Spirochaetia bacterium]